MITIHGSNVSPFVRKTLICLTEKGVDFELNPIAPFPPPDSHLKISPLGKIPAMTDGDLAIPDSSAICGYLEKRFPEPSLYPTDDGEYGRALWYEDWADNELPKATSALFFNRIAVRMMKREPDEAVINKILTDVQPGIFDYIEAEIGDKTYLAGDAFSIADIAMTCQFIQMQYAGESLPAQSHPNIARYISNHMQRASFKQWINKDGFMTLE
ncbi:MAG: glutathione S-transferase family protein [Pseudomonadota bacterium]